MKNKEKADAEDEDVDDKYTIDAKDKAKIDLWDSFQVLEQKGKDFETKVNTLMQDYLNTKKFADKFFPYTEKNIKELAAEVDTPLADLREASDKIEKELADEIKAVGDAKEKLEKAKKAYWDALQADDNLKKLADDEKFWTMVFPMLARGDDKKFGFLKAAKEYEEDIDHKLKIKAITEEVADELKEMNEIYEKAEKEKVDDFNEALQNAIAAA